ncbi:hypothetical protein [Sphingopyxis fribergensis]|nr:hypothetical protein [Sphingopyxis fribergensis]
MSWTKVGPGKYRVWVADVHLTFKTQRDAERFCAAAYRATKRSWE